MPPYRSPPKIDASVMAEICETSDCKPLVIERSTHEDDKFWYPPQDYRSEKNRDILSQMSAVHGYRQKS